MKYKSNKLRKLENDRFSLFNKEEQCYFCKGTHNLTWHEIIDGKNRQNSMKYGLCLRICLNCHRRITNDIPFKKEWYKKAQLKFEKVYPNLDFLDIFHKNYKD